MGDGAAFHARGATVASFVDAMSAACGLDTPSSWQDLVEALKAEDRHQIVAVAVDALDEAQSYRDIAELRLAFWNLAQLSWLRIAVATRPLSARDIFGPRSHLYELGVTWGEKSPNLVDLDSDRFFPPRTSSPTPTPCSLRTGLPIPGPPLVGPGSPTWRTRLCANGSLT